MKTIGKITTIIAAIVLFSAFTNRHEVKNFSSAAGEEERDVKNFSEIAMSISGTVYIKQGSSFKVILEGDQNDLDKIETVVEGDKLNIKTKSWTNNIGKITAYVTCPKIEGLYVAGSGAMIAENDIATGELDIAVSGSGELKLKGVQGEEIEIRVSGSGDVYFENEGRAEEADISISGSGKVYADNLQVNKCDAHISGSGSCKIHVTNELEARISGSGSVYYKGNPKIDASSSGSGKVKSL